MPEQSLQFDPEEPLDEWLRRLPAKWCVFLLQDLERRPLQLLCAKDLRASVARRLTGEESDSPTRRVDYRKIVRHVAWMRVDSTFEQDLRYLQAARDNFPETYQDVLGFRPAWWVHVDTEAKHPRFARVSDFRSGAGRYFGPFPGKGVAERFVRDVEGLFDLCRDHAKLQASPAGPCQWRQMGSCVGPCDGSVSLDAYRALVAHAADVLGNVERSIENQKIRLAHASAALEFETAGRIHQYIGDLEKLTDRKCRYVKPLQRFGFLAVLPGPTAASLKLAVARPGGVEFFACLRDAHDATDRPALLQLALECLARPPREPLPATAAETISLVTHHLFLPRSDAVWLQADELDERTLARAVRAVANPKKPPAAEQGRFDPADLRSLGTL